MAIGPILGVILAGGASRRFGSEKSAALLGGRTLLAWVAERACPQVELLLLNVNGPEVGGSIPEVERIGDNAPGEGPVAGILAALAEAERRGFGLVASFACDTPFFPNNTVVKLEAALHSSAADYAVASCGVNAHRIFALWPLACHTQLEHAFANSARSMREVEHWLEPTWADFPRDGGPDGDPFFNINVPEDLAIAELWLAGFKGS